MKILYYSPHPDISSKTNSGAGTHIREMINAFKKLGHKVHPLIIGDTFQDQATNRSISNNKGVKSTVKKVLPKSLKTNLKDYLFIKRDVENYKLLEKRIQEEQPDMIYERGIYLLKSGVELANKYNIPHVIEINAPFKEEKQAMQGKSIYQNKLDQIEKFNFENTNLIVFVSQALQKYYIKMYPFIKEKSLVTPNGINPDSIPEIKSDNIKERYNLQDNTVIGFVGSIFPYHGVDLLIQAFAKLIEDQRKPLKLMIVGDGQIRKELEDLTYNLGIDDRVIFTGYVDHQTVFNYIDVFDVAVMVKSNWYGSPVKIFEYAALKKAVIATHQPPVKEVIVDGVEGIIVNESIVEILSALERLINNPELIERIGENIYKKVMSDFTWKSNAQRVLNEVVNE